MVYRIIEHLGETVLANIDDVFRDPIEVRENPETPNRIL